MEYTETIDRYLHGDLSPDELEAFNLKLKTDLHFAKKEDEFARILGHIRSNYERYGTIKREEQEKYLHTILSGSGTEKETTEEQIREAISAYRAKKKQDPGFDMPLRNELDKAYENFIMTEKMAVRRKNKLVYYAAASVLIIIIFLSVCFIFSERKRLSPDEVFGKYYISYLPAKNYRSSEPGKDLLQQAINLYQSGKCMEAINLLNDSMPGDDRIQIINFYKGVSYMELREYDMASDMFRYVLNNDPNQLKDACKFYLALTCLKRNEVEEAGRLLNELKGSVGHYKNKAVEILEELDI
ncbi:MAG: hypothetical protein KJ607_09790 [Bacteroidetes bacterium]|nr:hypothetical protein [Bacteroidota bacterium]